MTTLRLFIPPQWQDSTTEYPWLLLDADGKPLRQSADALSSLPVASDTEIIIPAEAVSFVTATLPAGNRKKVLQALPFIIEDSLMLPPEQVHVVIAETLGSRDAVLATIEKHFLAKLLATLAQAQITPDRAIPAQLLPALPLDGWAVVIAPDQAFVRKNISSGLALDIDQHDVPPLSLELAIRHAREQGAPPDSLRIYGSNQLDITAWQQLLGVPCQIHHADWRASQLDHTCNLLQGSFTPASAGWGWLNQARPALWLAAALIMIQTIAIGIDWAHLAHQQKQLDQAMVSLFKTTFPDASTIVDAPLQMDRKFAEISHASGNVGGQDFLPMLAYVSSRIGNLSQYHISKLDYDEGKLILGLEAASEPEAQALAQKTNASGTYAEIENLKSTTHGVAFNLIIKADR